VPTRTRAARAARKRRTRMARVTHDLTPVQWAALQEAWAGCAYCGAAAGPFQKDCVLPISRGGRYTVTNVVPACGSCNASKCNDEVTGWLRRKRLDEKAFLVRHHQVLCLLGPPAP
jgi:5-methylcytosine-specific restriction endonuclease McrA